MKGVLTVFDPDSANEETRRLSRLAQSCWSPLTIVYDPLKAGSIDSTDTVPHDKAIVRAQNADYAPNKRIKGRPECTVFIGNLSSTTTDRSLGDEFSRYGRVVKATVVRDIITGRSRGYGFVEYSLEGEAAKAYEHAHRSWLDGNKVAVDMECGRLLPGWVPRRLGGGFNGRKESGQLRFGCRERPFRKPIKLLSEKEIKMVFEKTMGRKLKDQVEGNTKLATNLEIGPESTGGQGDRRRASKDERNDDGSSGGKGSSRRSSDGESRKVKEGSSERDRRRERDIGSRKRDGESSKRNSESSKRDRESSKRDRESKRAERKGKRDQRSDSPNQEIRPKRDRDDVKHNVQGDADASEQGSKRIERDRQSSKKKKKKKKKKRDKKKRRSRSRSYSTPAESDSDSHDD